MLGWKKQDVIGTLKIDSRFLGEVRLEYVKEKGALKTHNNVYLVISFNKNYTIRHMFREFNLKIPFDFSRNGKNWSCRINNTQHLFALIEKLKERGFDIKDLRNNPGLQKYIANSD